MRDCVGVCEFVIVVVVVCLRSTVCHSANFVHASLLPRAPLLTVLDMEAIETSSSDSNPRVLARAPLLTVLDMEAIETSSSDSNPGVSARFVSWGNLGFNLGPARSRGCMLEIKREVLHADRSFVEDLGFQGPHESTTSAHQFATMK